MIPTGPERDDEVETGGELNHTEEAVPLVLPVEPVPGNGNVLPGTGHLEDTPAYHAAEQEDEES
jgi:hypothetical protein